MDSFLIPWPTFIVMEVALFEWNGVGGGVLRARPDQHLQFAYGCGLSLFAVPPSPVTLPHLS